MDEQKAPAEDFVIHPHTELKMVNPEIGYGVFATAPIPEGTITYVKDTLELEITPDDFMNHSEAMRATIEKYSYTDPRGVRIVSWDFAKYVNHCCACNTISTGYGFEIAIRDIAAGEQITDEYGIFNLTEPMAVTCCEQGCRQAVRPDDLDRYYRTWDAQIQRSITRLFQVEQPLLGLVDRETRRELEGLREHPQRYRSVYALKYAGDATRERLQG